MLSAFFWGLIATSSLVLGGLIATRVKLSKKLVGIIMAFGAGTLISAISYELIFEAVQMARLTGFPALGLFAGAFTFFCSDALIAKFSAGNEPETATATTSPSLTPTSRSIRKITAAQFGFMDVCLAGRCPLSEVTGLDETPIKPDS